jgi:hypothetical protein
MALAVPDFAKMNSLWYLVRLYHDVTWQAAAPVERFSAWLRRALPTAALPAPPTTTAALPALRSTAARDTGEPPTECAPYVCPAHAVSPDAPRCSEYTCATHRDAQAGVGEPQLISLADMAALPLALRDAFLARADEYYAFLIGCALKNITPTALHYAPAGDRLVVRVEV